MKRRILKKIDQAIRQLKNCDNSDFNIGMKIGLKIGQRAVKYVPDTSYVQKALETLTEGESDRKGQGIRSGLSTILQLIIDN